MTKTTTATNQPQRIQRQRTKGYRMPPNTVSVCHPGKWGNPFKSGDPVQNRVCVTTAVMSGAIGPEEYKNNAPITAEQAVKLYKYHLTQGGKYLPLEELRGKNLACFCPLDRPCHADVLLELAKKP